MNISVNNETNNVQYSDRIIVVDDNFNRLLICICVLSVHIIYGVLDDLKYDLIEQLRNAVKKVVVSEEDYIGEHIFESDWIDENLLRTSQQLYWGIVYFILGHETAHSLLKDKELEILEEERLCDQYAYELVVELINGDKLSEHFSYIHS